ncbi:putative mRNA transport regulator [Xylona heveae TC161]|uniref:Putative mRNA transport regulator n=1 Tax=Xylona heveae (strain CBS 132557 / TC161) TaxID=1328760 RepID=A0A165IUR2_XYLHT|nr:putative mRNA transport regulator [Xylona heveae TC161]KZF25416.1 putative mRNA transport regulator [Xylona heveae TC161]
MATNGAAAQEAFAPVLTALATMQGNVSRSQKAQAHEFLEKFQKSPEAWTTTIALLQSTDASPESKLFSATTLKGKITYDIEQLPRETLPALRDSLLSLLTSYRAGPRPVRIQLCVCLANLAIFMLEWKNVLQTIVATLGTEAENLSCILDFLRVLPEEVTEGRKIHLTEDELAQRTKELLEDNAGQVLNLLGQYSQSSESAATNPQLLECITSWLREVPISDIVQSPLLDIVVNALSVDDSFESAVECMCAIFKETRDVDETLGVIQTLYPRVVALRPKIAQAAEEEDLEMFKGVTRLFAEAGEAWVVLIARLPSQFRGLVEAVLECAARDKDRESISLTFLFWYELKQYLTLEKYIQARMEYADIYSKLVDIMVKHLEFPRPEGGNDTDLFDGDREQEEKFRQFRHQMGDVLKDCCEVIGVTECLGKAFQLIQQWVSKYASQATDTNVPHWQELEAPLFSMRAMGRMVSSEESHVLPQVMPLLVQIPSHEKVRFQAIMALARYTEWTAEHPEFLESQLQYIIAGFQHPSKEVVRASALALRYFCNDCKDLLKDHVTQLQSFYESVIDKLPTASQEEVTEGVASVVSAQPVDKVYQTFKLYCDPLMTRLMHLANHAHDEKGKLAVADHLQLITIFVQWVQPYVSPSEANPAVKYCQEIFPVLATISDNFTTFPPILERVCRCWRHMVLSYRTAISPMLPALADKLASGFAASKQGCFLWATDSIVREFAEGAEFVDQTTTDAIFQFFEQQAVTFFRALNDLPPEDLPDVIEDFFRLLIDALLYYPYKFIPSALTTHILSAALTALTLQQVEPLAATLHFLRDLLAYGSETPPGSSFDTAGSTTTNPPEIRAAVKQLFLAHGDEMVKRLLTGMMFHFPKDSIPDASGALLGLFELLPTEVAIWIKQTVELLPQGSVSPQETERLMNGISQRIQSGELRKLRVLIQDFTTSYRRRNVAPREGLGRLAASRFSYSG